MFRKVNVTHLNNSLINMQATQFGEGLVLIRDRCQVE